MSNKAMTEDQIVDMLQYLGSEKIKQKNSKGNIQACCTVHGERTPSMGINIEKQVCNCFSCHFSGNIPWLVFKSSDEFKSLDEATRWLKARYNVDFGSFNLEDVKELKRYEEQYTEKIIPQRKVVPLSYIAVFKSGKETFQYFYDRGFTKKTVKDFRIGRDLTNNTVTVPIFYDDNTLAGVIGRYISPNRKKNERYKIYEETPTAEIVFPMDRIESIDDTLVIVEGLLDSVWMHQLGYINTGALLTNNLSHKQAKWIKSRFKRVIDMTDNDEMGELASKSIKEKLGKELIVMTVKHAYPEGKKDPQDCSKEEIDYMMSQARSVIRKELKRL